MSTQCVLILAGASNFKADSVAGWSEIHGHFSCFPQCDFVHSNFDERLNILVILDLIDRVGAQSLYCCFRWQHRGRVPDRAVAAPIPVFPWWVAAVELTAAPKPVPLLPLFPEDFGGEPVTGPRSIWALVGFRPLQGVGEALRNAAFFCTFAGSDQRRPFRRAHQCCSS